jgi:phosphoglycolate/pyridoxal phosphate phosphatase family enzyme
MPELIDDLKSIKVAIFDLDGVIYRGDKLIPGVTNIINLLKSLSIKVIFNSNNSTLTRKKYVEKLQNFGINSNIEDIFTSAYLTAEEITKMNARAKIYVIGEIGLKKELQAKGHQVLDVENDSSVIDYVIVGLDRNFDYQKLAIAQNYISQGHAQFYATNADATLPDKEKELPGAGSMVAALQKCTNQEPHKIFGKPSPLGIKMILEKTRVEVHKAAIFGDRLDTDILAGNRANIKTVLVLTGVTTLEQANQLNNNKDNIDINLIPNIILHSLEEMFKKL